MSLFTTSLLLYLGCSCFAPATAAGWNAVRESWTARSFDGAESAVGALLTQLVTLRHRRRPMRCVSLMLDPRFAQSLADSKLNQQTPMLVNVMDYQQQPLRNSSAFEALERARNEGCQMVAIFLHNGKKLAQLLRAADRWRFLNPRAVMILPFDLRLYLPKMHNFWRRFVNVVFIRARGLSPRLTATRSQRRRCLELSSVSFPAPVDPDHPETWLPLPLVTWCENMPLVKVGKLFDNKTNDMLGEVVKVAFFQHPPAAQKAEKSENAYSSLIKFRGVEVQILSLLSKSINFTPLLKEVRENKSAGVVEELVEGSADVALGSLANVPYFQQTVDLSDAYATYCYSFLTPEVVGDLSWRTLLLPFDKFLWVSTGVALLVGWISLHIVARCQKEDSQLRLLLPSALNTLSMQLMVPLPKTPSGWPLRFLFLCFWLHCLLLSVSYRASFASQLAKPAPRIALDTVDKLASAEHLALLTHEFFAKEMFISTSDMSSNMIGERIQQAVQKSDDDIIEEIKMGKAAFFGNVHLLSAMKARADEKTQGTYHVHLNEECVVSLPVSLGLARNSALTPQVNRVVRRALEMGLVAKWLHEGAKRQTSPESAHALVDLPKTISVFAALSVGHMLAACTFLLEIALPKRWLKAIS